MSTENKKTNKILRDVESDSFNLFNSTTEAFENGIPFLLIVLAALSSIYLLIKDEYINNDDTLKDQQDGR